MTDDDDIWNTDSPLDPSPSQPPGVDAHYYANLVDDLYGDTYSRNSIDDAAMPIISTVHYDAGCCKRSTPTRARWTPPLSRTGSSVRT